MHVHHTTLISHHNISLITACTPQHIDTTTQYTAHRCMYTTPLYMATPQYTTHQCMYTTPHCYHTTIHHSSVHVCNTTLVPHHNRPLIGACMQYHIGTTPQYTGHRFKYTTLVPQHNTPHMLMHVHYTTLIPHHNASLITACTPHHNTLLISSCTPYHIGTITQYTTHWYINTTPHPTRNLVFAPLPHTLPEKCRTLA